MFVVNMYICIYYYLSILWIMMIKRNKVNLWHIFIKILYGYLNKFILSKNLFSLTYFFSSLLSFLWLLFSLYKNFFKVVIKFHSLSPTINNNFCLEKEYVTCHIHIYFNYVPAQWLPSPFLLILWYSMGLLLWRNYREIFWIL